MVVGAEGLRNVTLATARDRRRQRQELIDYLASDRRAARDLGITIYELDNLCR